MPSVCAELWEVKWGLANEWPMGYRDLMLEPKGGLKVIDRLDQEGKE